MKVFYYICSSKDSHKCLDSSCTAPLTVGDKSVLIAPSTPKSVDEGISPAYYCIPTTSCLNTNMHLIGCSQWDKCFTQAPLLLKPPCVELGGANRTTHGLNFHRFNRNQLRFEICIGSLCTKNTY